jgi:ATP-binding cassette subfamily C (CFTR/MRP) protein 1
MKFFDTNPIGRIVNRFTSDLDTMDQMIPFALMDFIWCLMECITIVLLISVTTPPFIGIMVPLIGIYFFIQKIYITSSRQIKRLYSISKSPIFSHFTETTNGASTIRAYKQQKRFIQDSQDKVSVNVTSIYLNFMSNLWMGTILENLGNLMIFFAALFAVFAKDSLSAGQAGLSITSSLQITG